MASLWLDLRYALRMMWRTPGLTAVLAITLALGIGASTTIFSVVNSVLLQPLPYRQPDRLIRIYTEFHGSLDLPSFAVSAPEYDDFRRDCRTCASVAAWGRGTASLAGGERPVRVDAAWATHTLLPTLGVDPQLGRFFDASEDRPGAEPTVVVLSDVIWRRAFGADPGAIGRRITLDAMPVTVIGVMPPGFDFLDRIDAWVPANLEFDVASRSGHNYAVIARLADGASLESMRSELAALTTRWAAAGGGGTDDHRISAAEHPMIAVPFQGDLVGSLATALWMLQAAVLFVLLIAVVNVANLLLARSESRTREVAVRHAVGASRRRLVRQFLTESLTLAVLGGGLGVLVAVWAVDGVRRLLPIAAPRASEIALDGTAIAFALACAVGAALLFGLAPILHARRSNLHGALKEGSPRTTGSRARLRVRRGLVIAEIALAVVLVVGCTVMVRSFMRLQRVELGYRPDHVLAFEIEIPEKHYPGVTGDVFWQRVLERMRALPDVTHATLLAGLPPMRSMNANSFRIPGRPDGREPPNVDYWQVFGSDAVDTLGARIVRGRGILPSDTFDAPHVVLINEAFAAKFFPGVDPVGRQVQMRMSGRSQTIVGIVANIRQAGIDKPPGTEVFFPQAQAAALRDPPRSRLSLQVLLRTAGDPELLIPSAYRAISELDPSLPLSHVQTMDDVVWEAVARPRFLTFLLGAFAAIALLLAAVGIYGVMAHTVAQRTHEIGLRVALGAAPAQVRRMIVRQAGGLVAVGVAIGLVVAIVLQAVLDRVLSGLFYGDTLSQPLLLGGVALGVAVTAILATWLPVRRATRIEPNVALRTE